MAIVGSDDARGLRLCGLMAVEAGAQAPAKRGKAPEPSPIGFQLAMFRHSSKSLIQNDRN